MVREPIPEDVTRFILTSIPSVPHLEAMLLMRQERTGPWDNTNVARRLYMSEAGVAQLLTDLQAAGILDIVESAVPSYCYRPRSPELENMIDRVADAYARNLVEVTNLIHSEMGKKARHFADAFKFRKDPTDG